MNRVPGGREVERALKKALQELRSGVKQINENAHRLFVKAEYGSVEVLISKAKEIGRFEGELEGIITQWRTILGESSDEAGKDKNEMPLWKYYIPTLHALIELGGSARRDAIEDKLESKIDEISAMNCIADGSVPFGWKSSIKKVLRAMEKEAFVKRDKKEWRITTEGRKAAEAKAKVGIR